MTEHTQSRTRPAVARAVSDRGVWMFVAFAAIGGGILFGSLEARRATLTAPAIAPEPGSEGGGIAPPPDIAIPQSWQTPAPAAVVPPIAQPTLPSTQPVATLPARTIRQEVPEYTPPPQIRPPQPGSVPLPTREGPAEVFRAPPPVSGAAGPKADPNAGKTDRVEASRLTNPATTVPKGTVLQAVLESALDSTRGGMARAVVSRDIYGFDGTKILIQRGSRLIGEYKADVQQGQNRALIQWQRLLRPDGVMINLDSPSADPLGRAGIKGKVNGHFLARYGGAILQSALQIGEQVAVNSLAPSTTIYAAPTLLGAQGALAPVNQAGAAPGSTIQPTITVKQGTSVSVFVARDLDFTSVEP